MPGRNWTALALDWSVMADFQQLDVYRCSLVFVRWVADLLPTLTRPYGELADQLRRASISVPLNIAEATGRRGKDRLHLNAIAYGSAKECMAILDVMGEMRISDEKTLEEGHRNLDRIIAMLAVMSELRVRPS